METIHRIHVGQLTNIIQELQKENNTLRRQVTILNKRCTTLEAELQNFKDTIAEMTRRTALKI